MNSFQDWMKKGGSLARKAAVAAGNGLADGFRAIDPDVRRHLFQVPLLGYTLLSAKHVPVQALPDDGHPPVVFVHGLGGDRGNFLLMSGYFRLMGRRRSYRIHFEPGRSAEDMAQALRDFIAEVRHVNEVDKVDIVAHSLGGLVSRLALSNEETARSLRMVVTLGTPHKGTYPARYANTELTRILRPDSDLMRRLAETPWPDSVTGVCFYSRNDVFVLPWESAVLEGLKAVDVTPFTHYSYLLEPKSFREVFHALEDVSTSESVPVRTGPTQEVFE